MSDHPIPLVLHPQRKPFRDRLSVIATPAVIVLLAFLIGGLVIWAIGADPIKAYNALLDSAFGSVNSLAETLVKACPLILAGLAISVAFRAQFWNVGVEGQIYSGAILATIVGVYVKGLPAAIHIPLSLLSGVVGGVLAGIVPGILKAKLRVNEVISTLMLNYIILDFTSYLVHGPLKDTASNLPISPPLLQSSVLPVLIPHTRLHWGIPLAIAMAFLTYYLIHKTTLGFQIQAVGENPRAAHVAGISIERTLVWTMMISGGLAGLAGAIEIMGVQNRLLENFSPGYGFLGIAVALVAKLSPIGVIFSSIIFAALLNGANTMQSIASVPIPVIYLIQGLVIIFASVGAIKIGFFRKKKVSE